MSIIGPDEGGKLVHALLAVQEVVRKPGQIPKCLFRGVGPDPVSYSKACSSEYSDVWMAAMGMSFDGLMAAENVAEGTETPGGAIPETSSCGTSRRVTRMVW